MFLHDYRLEFFHLGLNQHPSALGGLRSKKIHQSCFMRRNSDNLKMPSAISFDSSRYSTSSYSVDVGLTYSIKVWFETSQRLEGCSSRNLLIISQKSQYCFPKMPNVAIKTVMFSILKLVIFELQSWILSKLSKTGISVFVKNFVKISVLYSINHFCAPPMETIAVRLRFLF